MKVAEIETASWQEIPELSGKGSKPQGPAFIILASPREHATASNQQLRYGPLSRMHQSDSSPFTFQIAVEPGWQESL